MKVMLSTTPMCRDNDALNGMESARPSTGMVYLASMLGKQGKFGTLKVADAILEEPNMNIRRFAESVAREKPDVFGFTAYEFNLKEARELRNLVKKISPETLVFVGGPTATLAPEYVARVTGADAVFRGESDFALPKVIKELDKGIPLRKISAPGFVPVVNGKPVWNPGSDKMPVLTLAEYKLIEPDISLIAGITSKTGYRLMDFAFSRGCPYKVVCSFCQFSTGVTNRWLGVDATIGILKQIAKIPGLILMCFGDAAVGNGKEGAIKLMREIEKEGMKFMFGYNGEWSLDMFLKQGKIGNREVDLEMINLMRSAHFGGEIGVESLTSGQLIKFNKMRHSFGETMRVLEALKANSICHNFGIFLWGFDTKPEDTIENIGRAFKLANGLGGTNMYIVNSPTPYFNTGEYQKFMKALADKSEAGRQVKTTLEMLGRLEDTGDRKFPYHMETTLPLDTLMLKAYVKQVHMHLSGLEKFVDYPPKGLFNSKEDELNLLSILISIKVEAEKDPARIETARKAQTALEEICKINGMAKMAGQIEYFARYK